ncbi:hypothetical protein GQ457_12G017730 [Hibiscus cannabinus]
MALVDFKIPNPGSVDLSFFPRPFSISSDGLFVRGLGAVDFPSRASSSVFTRDIGRVPEDGWSQGLCGEGVLLYPVELSEDLRWYEVFSPFETFSNPMTVERWLGCLNGSDFSGIRLWRLPPREASSICISESSMEGGNRGKSQTLELLWPFRRRAIKDHVPSVSRLLYALEFSTGGLLKYQVFDVGGISHFWFILSETLGDGIRWKAGSGKKAQGMGVGECHEFRESFEDSSRRALLVDVPFQVKDPFYSWCYWFVLKNGIMVCSSFRVKLWVSISANLMIVSYAFSAYSCLWLDVREPMFFQSVMFVFSGAFFPDFIRIWLLCFIKFGRVMARVIVNLQFHLLVMLINVGIIKLMECFSLKVGDKVGGDSLSAVCKWGYHVLSDGSLHSYPKTGFLRDGAGLYTFRLMKVYVRLLETSLFSYNKLLSDFNFFHHVLKDFVKIWSDCFTIWVKVVNYLSAADDSREGHPHYP